MVTILLGGLIFAVFCIYPFWRVFARAGLPPALSLLVFLPLGGFIAPMILAFSRWPNALPPAR
ncbi:hypothetical protein HBA54_06020 [Pelagibius litoralis]|uniref:Uncharacterized protein n=1 Tax=Pelagibius litoralis TaxID=374515 RepID=A0A967C7S3_9PROT|nr:hypothetical protein [Pelagibius litoralis]NIA68142.1 hypothetical protein [Pelagibius litoralis]